MSSGWIACKALVCVLQAEDGIRDLTVTGVQTCALPIYRREVALRRLALGRGRVRGGGARPRVGRARAGGSYGLRARGARPALGTARGRARAGGEIGRASWRGRGWISGVAGSLKEKK